MTGDSLFVAMALLFTFVLMPGYLAWEYFHEYKRMKAKDQEERQVEAKAAAPQVKPKEAGKTAQPGTREPAKAPATTKAEQPAQTTPAPAPENAEATGPDKAEPSDTGSKG